MSAFTTLLASLLDRLRLAYVRHARRPDVVGPVAEHRKLWGAHYEARAAAADENPAFAATLLPRTGALTVAGPGLPVRPAGVRWAVDEAAPRTISLAIDVTGAITLSVQGPRSRVPFTPLVASGATRSTTVFDAAQDGLYTVRVLRAGSVMATLLIPVQRAAFARFRELSRALAFAFQTDRPRPTEEYDTLLALVIGAEAAAATGQADLFAELSAAALAVPLSSTPTALYPHG